MCSERRVLWGGRMVDVAYSDTSAEVYLGLGVDIPTSSVSSFMGENLYGSFDRMDASLAQCAQAPFPPGTLVPIYNVVREPIDVDVFVGAVNRPPAQHSTAYRPPVYRPSAYRPSAPSAYRSSATYGSMIRVLVRTQQWCVHAYVLVSYSYCSGLRSRVTIRGRSRSA